MPNILIGGSVCPINRNMPYFLAGDAGALFNDLMVEFECADLTVISLECPLIERKSPIPKNGVVLGVNCACIAAIENAGIEVVNLANNHILDHGAEGLLNTIAVCRSRGIDVVGAGVNLGKAGDILIRQVDSLKIAIMSFAEHEFSIATEISPGANPLSLIEFVRGVRQYRNDFDYLIVLLHFGKEDYPYPSPKMQQICRFMVEEGANAVICQHSHCPGCYEEYAGGHIVYGQGDLIFDTNYKRLQTWYQGYLVKLSILSNNESRIHIIPYAQSANRGGARKMNKAEEEYFKLGLRQQSALIKDRNFVEKRWVQFCRNNKYIYFSILRGHNRLLRQLNSRFHFSDILYSKNSLLGLQNIVNCEADREVLETILLDISQ